MGRRKNAAHKSVRMPVTRGLALRSRVPGNWHARFWSRGGGSDSLVYCNRTRPLLRFWTDVNGCGWGRAAEAERVSRSLPRIAAS
jgi:hypothetical protein